MSLTNTISSILSTFSSHISRNIEFPQGKIVTFCQKWQIDKLSLFGSVLRDDFCPHSDVDMLVHFHPEARHSLFDLARMEDELTQIVGRNVDLISRRGIEMSRNYLRKQAILESAEVLYGT